MSGDGRPFGWGYDKSVAEGLARWSRIIGDTEALALCERVQAKDPEAADEVHRRWAACPWIGYTRGLTDAQLRARFGPGTELAANVRAAVAGLTDLGQISDVAERVYEQALAGPVVDEPVVDEPVVDEPAVTVWIGRSAGKDGAVLVVIDTGGFEPDGSTPGRPALRVNVNDGTVYAGVDYDAGGGSVEHPLGEAPWREYTVPLSEIAYPGRGGFPAEDGAEQAISGAG